MKNTAIILGVWIGLVWGCSSAEEEVTGLPQGRVELEIGLEEVPSAEKSLLLFFRKFETGDTLAFIREIEGPGKDFVSYTIEVPVGYYQLVLVGNGDLQHIRSGNPASVSNSSIVYEGGVEPPDLYFGKILVNVGEQEKALAGLVILSSRIALTIHDIPANVSRVDVDLRNTSSGVTFNLEQIQKLTDPSISQSLYDVTAGSSPVLNFKCLPTIPSIDSTFFEVRCYDATEHLVYRGRSEKLMLGGAEDIKMGCSFGGTGKVTGLKGKSDYQFALYPETGQK